VYREREKGKGKERKNREKMKFFVIFFSKKLIPGNQIGPDGEETLPGVLAQCPALAHLNLSRQKKYKKIKKMPWHQGDRAGVSCHPGVRVPI